MAKTLEKQHLTETDAEAVRRKVESGEDVELPGAVRATIGIFNNHDDLDKLVAAVTELASGVGVDRDAEIRRLDSSACVE